MKLIFKSKLNAAFINDLSIFEQLHIYIVQKRHPPTFLTLLNQGYISIAID